jgi:hypothetical protein
MIAIASLVAAGGRSGDLVVGLVIGMAAGLLVGPAFRSWVARREWNDASRRARLTDELLTRMDDEPPDPDGASGLDASTTGPPREPGDRRVSVHRWQQR